MPNSQLPIIHLALSLRSSQFPARQVRKSLPYFVCAYMMASCLQEMHTNFFEMGCMLFQTPHNATHCFYFKS